jgi:hypothetical protein
MGSMVALSAAEEISLVVAEFAVWDCLHSASQECLVCRLLQYLQISAGGMFGSGFACG